MKKLLLIFTIPYLFFYSNYSLSQNGWVIKDDYFPNRAIYFLDQNTGWIGGTDQMMKTTDGGINWQPDIFFGNILSITFINDNTGFIGCQDLYKTTNKGNNWFIINTGLSISGFYSFSFVNENTGWVNSGSHNILKTTNCGDNWFVCLDGQAYVNSIFFVNAMTGWCARFSPFVDPPFIKTTNGGANWFAQNVDSTKNNFDCLMFIDVNTGYCTSYNLLYKTTNSGNTWLLINNNIYPNKLKFVNYNTGYAGCSDALKKTTNGGINFFNSDSVNSASIWDVFLLNQNIGWYTGDYGLIKKTTNSGLNWQNQLSRNYQPGNDVSINRINENTVWAGIIKSTNKGENWNGYTTENFYTMDCSYFINDSTGFVNYTYTMYPNIYQEKIYKTTNSGINWSVVLSFSSSPYIKFDNIYFKDNITGWATGTNGVMYKTTTSGDTWTAQTSGTTNTLRKMIFIDSSTGFCTSDNGSLLKTVNSGASWNLVSTGASGSLYGIYYINELTGWFTGGNGQIYKTINSGQNWTAQFSGTTRLIYNIYFVDNDYGWACGQNGVILKTLNSGNNWRIDADNIGDYTRNIYFFDHYTGFCYGARMIIRTTTGGATWIKDVNNNIPTDFSLSQNYPNPFNPTTSIRYKVESIKQIRLVVYDILGKELTTLVNEKQKPGEYEVTFNAADLPSGMYFYALYADGVRVETRKMVLIK